MKLLQQQIIDYEKYTSGELKVIGLPVALHRDSIVNKHFSYSEWILNHKTQPVIKVEGLEKVKKIKTQFKNLSPINIHLFVSQETGHSFKWHKDSLHVYLYVVRGFKIVKIKNKTYKIRSGQGVMIPRGYLHKVFSKKGTWALSIGY